MRIWQCGLAAVVVSCTFATPASAQRPVPDGGVQPGSTLSYTEALDRRGDRTRSGPLFPERVEGIGLSSQRGVEQDGSRASRNGLIGSWPVAENMNVGIGIFSVTRYSAKERDFKRTQPMKDVGERTGSLAAIGFSVRF